MGKFFHGWRRKVGVATLVMACALTAGWVRSLSICDWVCMRSGSSHVHVFLSNNAELIWDSRNQAASRAFYGMHRAQSDILKSIAIERHWEFCGFHAIKGIVTVMKTPTSLWIAPYWFIVMPLTLLSAYLLLSKPRSSIPKKDVEPVPAEGV